MKKLLFEKSVVFFLAIGLVFFISGCAEKKIEKPAKEIGLSQECGLDRLPCCANEPICSFGQQCCSDPGGSSLNYCANKCTCGAKNDFCCQDGQKCQTNLVCHESICQPCGQEEELCCEGEKKCMQELICQNNNCTKCGTENQPCCPGKKKCLNDSTKDESRTECKNDICAKCGGGGAPICFGEPPCNSGNLKNNDNCLLCGEANTPCCDKNSGRNYECNPSKNLKCNLGFCSE